MVLSKNTILTIICPLFLTLSANSAEARSNKNECAVKSVSINGYVGQRIKDCIDGRVKTQDVGEITGVFSKQDEVHELWGSEFWGKWVQGAIASYQYAKDPQLLEMIKKSEELMMGYQLKDGYLGNYDKEHQLTGWDVWGRKYCTLGLLKWYDLSGDRKALQAACRLIDYTIGQVGTGKIPIYKTGNYYGMASSSILEPVVLLYNRTKDAKYLEFANCIVSTDESAGGPQLIAKANQPVCSRFPLKENETWYSVHNGQKAYEMMSCYVGLLELYAVTGKAEYLDAVKTAVRHIEDEEINICGSGSSFECWMNGKARQTRPAYHSMETCVGFTWMQLNERLLKATGDPHYADNMEQTFYNAILGSMKDDGSQIAKYTPLEGFRHEGKKQCHMNINCCNANGPRAFAMVPRFMYRLPENDKRIDVNFYSPSTAEIQLGKNNVRLVQNTDYPKTGSIALTVNPQKAANFTLVLRIPQWSKETKVTVNGQEQIGVSAGSYLTLNRQWAPGDKVEVQMDMRTRLSLLNNQQALQRGPITLARDSRFQDGFVDETCVIPDKDGYVDAKLVDAPQGIWMALEINAVLGTDRENFSKPQPIHFCDFASAGNTWNRTVRYRTWLNKTLDARLEQR